jgi:methyl-accepting chemotaxis protein
VVASTRVLDQIQNGAYDTAIAADKMLARAKQHIQRVEQQVDAIEKIVDARAQATQASFEASMQLTMWLFVGVLGVVVVVVVPLTLLNSHAIITPMQQARDLAMAIAKGDLSRSVQIDGQDEASGLLRALAHMQAALGGLVGEVRQASENIHTASNEVASGNTDLSGRTEQAAREIKTLIGASVDKVDAGTRLVKDAGSTMADIVTSVQRVADIIREISSATQQQSTGIGQVNGAVSTLDQMTQPPDIIICDIFMPQMDGIEFVAELVGDGGEFCDG